MLESAHEYWNHYGPRMLKEHPERGYVAISPKAELLDTRLSAYRTLANIRRDFPNYYPGFKAKTSSLIFSLSDEMWKQAPKREARVIFSTRDFMWRAVN